MRSRFLHHVLVALLLLQGVFGIGAGRTVCVALATGEFRTQPCADLHAPICVDARGCTEDHAHDAPHDHVPVSDSREHTSHDGCDCRIHVSVPRELATAHLSDIVVLQCTLFAVHASVADCMQSMEVRRLSAATAHPPDSWCTAAVIALCATRLLI
ncbi:MAG: hypothetical protein EXS10_06155 [Phycisphaerales bacterium]|nr:hypothetical protein [Phycisphaerales bacterium]